MNDGSIALNKGDEIVTFEYTGADSNHVIPLSESSLETPFYVDISVAVADTHVEADLVPAELIKATHAGLIAIVLGGIQVRGEGL